MNAPSQLFAACCIGGLLTAAAANYFVDPTDILTKPATSTSPYSNQRYMKAHHLLTEPAYDVLLMGSSRIGLVAPHALSSLVAARGWNASWFDARPSEILAVAQAIKEEGRLPDQIVLGLDLAFFANQAPVSPLLQHPKITGESDMKWWIRNLFAPNGPAILSGSFLPQPKIPMISLDYDLSGSYKLPSFEARIAADHAGFIQSNVEIEAPVERPFSLSETELAAYRDLVSFLSMSDVEICAFWMPHRSDVLAAYPREDVVATATLIESISPLVAASPYSDLSNDLTRWFDAKHLISNEAEQFVDRMIVDCKIASQI